MSNGVTHPSGSLALALGILSVLAFAVLFQFGMEDMPEMGEVGVWTLATSNLLLWSRMSRLERDVRDVIEIRKKGRA